MNELSDLFQRAANEFGKRVEAIEDDQWHNQTACDEWDVRVLVNHLVYENRWVPPLLAGKTIAEVGDRFEGDLLGDDPKGSWRDSLEEAVSAVDQPGVAERVVHVSFGDIPGEVYLYQVLCDHIVHAWDLASGIDADRNLSNDLVDLAYDFYEPQIQAWRASGAFQGGVDAPPDADPQTKLLALTGRRA